jgi:hypothetical protein
MLIRLGDWISRNMAKAWGGLALLLVLAFAAGAYAIVVSQNAQSDVRAVINPTDDELRAAISNAVSVCAKDRGCYSQLSTLGGRGRTGPKGARGPRGAPGSRGPRGATGVRGPAGPAGPRGATGARGQSGPRGRPGATGAVGATGPQGPQGERGPRGLPGVVPCISALPITC